MKLNDEDSLNITVKGSYIFRQNGEIILQGNNLITLWGESFFLRRPINQDFKPIQYICLGNGTNRPQKHDLNLGNETVREECLNIADTKKKQMILKAVFNVCDVEGVSEIGVVNDKILISHDVFDEIKLNDNVTNENIEVEYTFQFSTSSLYKGWVQKVDGDWKYDHIYYIDEPSRIMEVYESDNEKGYVKVNKLTDLKTIEGAYYYNPHLEKLYICTSQRDNPLNHNIIVQTQ